MRMILAVLTLITVLIVSPAVAQAPLVTEQERAMVDTWHALGQSIVIEDKAVGELTKSLQMNPPWRIVDARAATRRADLIDEIISEHERRIKLLKRLKQLDSQ